MILLILTMLLGIFFAFFATQNTAAVPINIADFTYTFPLYLVVSAGLIIGLFIGMLYNFFEKIGNYSTLRSKKTDIQRLKVNNKKLREKIAIMESKNADLKEDLGEKKHEIREQKVENVKEDTQDFFGKIKKSLTF